jgi:tripartite-type tricarboxylate transporter receptor subunit TctC
MTLAISESTGRFVTCSLPDLQLTALSRSAGARGFAQRTGTACNRGPIRVRDIEIALVPSGGQSMKLMRRQFLKVAGAIVAFPAISRIAHSQAWPSKPIRVIVPTGAGSATDVVPRIIFEPLSVQLGQPIIVENRPGAGGTLGTNAVAKAESDGHTLLAISSAYTVLPWVYPKLPYDAVRDLSAIISLGSLPTVLVTSSANGFMTIGELVAAARAKPGSFNYTSTGTGNATHLNAERFRASAGIAAVHIPVRSGPEALTEVMSGRAEFYFCPVGTALPFIRDGKLRGLVVSALNRAAELPDVPTTAEAGFTDADYTLWIGLFAPAKTPRGIIDRLHDETAKAMRTSNVREKLAILGVVPMPMTPEQFDARVREEIASNAMLVRAAGIRPE